MAKQSNIPHSRRIILAGILATIAKPAFAGGDGGGGFRKQPNVKDRYSQKEFSRLSKNEIDQLYFILTQGKQTQVDGFSTNMVDRLIYMATAHRRRTAKLIREMKDIAAKDKRKARLRQELTWADDQLGLLKASLKRAKEKNSKAAIEETELQLVLIHRYRDGLVTWIKFPHEGQR